MNATRNATKPAALNTVLKTNRWGITYIVQNGREVGTFEFCHGTWGRLSMQGSGFSPLDADRAKAEALALVTRW